MKIALLFAIILSFNAARASDSLSLLTMNVYMLPKPIKWSMQLERTNAIADQLAESSYDIVFMQEAFMASFRSEIENKLKLQFPYSSYLDRDKSWTHVFGSGLFILSRHPFKVIDKVYFSDCAGFDCFASKGAVLIEISLPGGRSYQVSNTHLQASPEYGAIRLHQLAEIKSIMNKHKKPAVSQMLVGDFNIDIDDPEFTTGLVTMQMNYSPLGGLIKTTNARTNDCYSTPENKLWIDHVWYDKSLVVMRPEIEVKDFSFNHDNKKCPSSDHHAVALKSHSKVVSK